MLTIDYGVKYHRSTKELVSLGPFQKETELVSLGIRGLRGNMALNEVNPTC